MECRKLEITLVSATNLPNIRNIGTMKVYARVSLKGEPKTTQKTLIDTRGSTNPPRWHFPVHFTIKESSLQQPGVTVVVKLLCKRSLGDRVIGEVNIGVKSLFDLGLKAEKIMSYDVVGTTTGRLNVLYRFEEEVMVVRKPSGWRSAVEVGFFVVVGGVLILLEHESDGDEKVGKGSRVCDVDDECEDDEISYDAIGD